MTVLGVADVIKLDSRLASELAPKISVPRSLQVLRKVTPRNVFLFQLIKRSGERLLAIVAAVIDFALITSDKMVLENEVFDLVRSENQSVCIGADRLFDDPRDSIS